MIDDDYFEVGMADDLKLKIKALQAKIKDLEERIEKLNLLLLDVSNTATEARNMADNGYCIHKHYEHSNP